MERLRQGIVSAPRRPTRSARRPASKVRLCLDALSSDTASIFEFEVLDAGESNLARVDRAYGVRSNAKGGKAYFIPSPQAVC